MAIEQGVIIKMGKGSKTAWVKTSRSSACESCSSRDSCDAGVGGQSQEVEAINTAQARVGDRIQLAIGTGSVMKVMFLLYLFPILCLFAGGVVGEWMAPLLALGPSASAAGMAMAGFGFAMIIVRIWGQRLGVKEAYRPKIIRILGHETIYNGEKSLSYDCTNPIENQR